MNSSMTKFRPTGDGASTGGQKLALGLVPPFDLFILLAFSDASQASVCLFGLALVPPSHTLILNTAHQSQSSACYWSSKAFLSTVRLMKNSFNNLMQPVWLPQLCWFGSHVVPYGASCVMRVQKNICWEKRPCAKGTVTAWHFTGHALRDISQSLGQAVL